MSTELNQNRFALTKRDFRRSFAAVLLAVVSFANVSATTSVYAAEITVLAAGAAKELIARIDGPFAHASGHRINATFDTVGAQRERVETGARPDAVILSAAAMVQLNKLGLIDAASIRDVGDVQVGLAVRAGDAEKAAPDIGTPDALSRALLAAKSIAYADPARGATAGSHFAKVLATLGIQDRVAGKVTVLPFGVEVIEAVAAGKFEIGVSQSSEIVQHKGVRYVGALPVPHRLATRYQIAALKDRPLGVSLADFVVTERGKHASRDSGFESPK